MSDELTKYEATMTNRCLKESLTLGLEFKRLLEHIFTDEAVKSSELLQKYQPHFLAFKGNFIASQNAFSEQLVNSIESLDDSKLSKCSSPQCPLPGCGPSVYDRIFSPKEYGELKKKAEKDAEKDIESPKVSVIKEKSLPRSASRKRPIFPNAPMLISRANDIDTALTVIPIINLNQQQAQTLPKTPISRQAPKTPHTLVLIQNTARTTGMSPSKPVMSKAPLIPPPNRIQQIHPLPTSTLDFSHVISEKDDSAYLEPPAKQIRPSVTFPTASSGTTPDTYSLVSSGQPARFMKLQFGRLAVAVSHWL